MRSPFVDSASFLPHHDEQRSFSRHWLLAIALVMAVAASSAILLAF
jgi:hypothetical protein